MTFAAEIEAPKPSADQAEQPVPTVLMVDDEASVLGALRRLFRPQGYKILQASSGAEGLELLRDNTVDVVISDMRMPGMDGARFLELARQHDGTIARILLTGYADIESTIAAINRGAIHRYIAKPWDDQELLVAVQEAMDRRQLERRNAELTELVRAQNEQLRDANHTLESRVASRTSELEQVNGMLEASYEELDNTFMLAVNVFSALLEMRETNAGHSRRVADLARDTAKRMGLSKREVRDVYLAALVHDVGKIGFPDSMLGKPVSAYTAEETQRYRRHPVDGETALMPLSQLQGAARIVRQHHERFDGKGFPDGLVGTAISIGARIVAPATDLDALMHGTLGSSRIKIDQARQMLVGGIDTRYERRVVETLLEVLAEAEKAAEADVLIEAHALRPGMVLARDLMSSQGAILLAAGYVFDERIIKQISDFSRREGVHLTLHVRQEAQQPGTPNMGAKPLKDQI